jgi:hypothetical protein
MEIIGTARPETRGPPWHLTAQNDQLMPEDRVLCFKPTPRLKGQSQYREQEAEQFLLP